MGHKLLSPPTPGHLTQLSITLPFTRRQFPDVPLERLFKNPSPWLFPQLPWLKEQGKTRVSTPQGLYVWRDCFVFISLFFCRMETNGSWPRNQSSLRIDFVAFLKTRGQHQSKPEGVSRWGEFSSRHPKSTGAAIERKEGKGCLVRPPDFTEPKVTLKWMIPCRPVVSWGRTQLRNSLNYHFLL